MAVAAAFLVGIVRRGVLGSGAGAAVLSTKFDVVIIFNGLESASG